MNISTSFLMGVAHMNFSMQIFNRSLHVSNSFMMSEIPVHPGSNKNMSTPVMDSRRRLHCLALHVRTPPAQVVMDHQHVTASLKSWSMWTSLLMSLLAGLSTTLGAVVVFSMPEVSPEKMAFALSLAAGAMLSVSILEFWWPSLTGESSKPASSVVFLSFLGAAAFLLLSTLLSEPKLVDDAGDQGEYELENMDKAPSSPTPKGASVDLEGDDSVFQMQPAGGFRNDVEKQRRWRLAGVMMLSLTAHNLPEGFAVAISALDSDRLGFVVMIAIALHNIPEGIALAVPVLSATGSKRKALWMSFISGMAEPLGAGLALLFAAVSGRTDGSVDSDIVEDLLCIVGGVMCAVAMKELLPEALRQHCPVFVLGGLITGIFVMWLTSYYT